MSPAVCSSLHGKAGPRLKGVFFVFVFFNSQLKNHQYNGCSVTGANSSRHTIVSHRNKLHWPEKKDKCVCEELSRWQLTKLTDKNADVKTVFLMSLPLCPGYLGNFVARRAFGQIPATLLILLDFIDSCCMFVCLFLCGRTFRPHYPLV